MARKTFVKIGSTWREVKAIWRRISGVWHTDVIDYIKISGTWKQCIDVNTYTSYLTVDASGWTILVAPSMSTYWGTISFSEATTDHDIASLLIRCRVYNKTNALVATVIFYNSAYSAYDSLDSYSEVVWGPPIPATGYHLILEFLES
jgi:hypothetical protein